MALGQLADEPVQRRRVPAGEQREQVARRGRRLDETKPGSGLGLSIVVELASLYGGALTLGYQLTPHVTLGVRYQHTSKDSDLLLRDYNQNRISLDGTYSF